MEKQYQIGLSHLDLGQVVDGLASRAQSWRDTAEFMESGVAPAADFVCEECSDVEEAMAVAQHYERIIASIQHQVGEQGG